MWQSLLKNGDTDADANKDGATALQYAYVDDKEAILDLLKNYATAKRTDES